MKTSERIVGFLEDFKQGLILNLENSEWDELSKLKGENALELVGMLLDWIKQD